MSAINEIQNVNSYNNYAIAVAKKAKDVVQAQGQAALQLIDSASVVSSASGANASPSGLGRYIDVRI